MQKNVFLRKAAALLSVFPLLVLLFASSAALVFADESGPPAAAAGPDFSSCRLIAASADESLFSDDPALIASYNGVYLLQFEDEAAAEEAYRFYLEKADIIEPDTGIAAADDDLTETSAEAATEDVTEEETSAAEDASIRVMTEDDNPLSELENAIAELEAAPEEAPDFDVALIDTGASVPDAAEAVSMIGDDPEDNNGHGTRMMEKILSQNPDAAILSIKALGDDGSGDISAVYAAIQYAVSRNVKVINLSMSARALSENAVIAEAVKEAACLGITVVGAAGNNSADAAGFIPGNIEEAVITGSADSTGKRRETSNYGATVDYNIVSQSTSEAAALMSGFLSCHDPAEIAYILNKGFIYEPGYIPPAVPERDPVLNPEYLTGEFHTSETAGGTTLATYTVKDASWDYETKTWTFRWYTLSGAQTFCCQFGVDYTTASDAYWLNTTDTSAAAKKICKLKFFVDMYGEILYGLDSTERTWIVQRYIWETGYNISSGSNTWRLKYNNGYADSVYDTVVTYALRGYDTGSVGIYVAGVGIQDLAKVSYSYGTLNINKSGKTHGYSMAGALYDIYKSDDSTYTGITIITNANGVGYVAKKTSSAPSSGLYTKNGSSYWVSTGRKAIYLIPGTYYVREYKVPDSGYYLKDTTHRKVTVSSGGSAAVTSPEAVVTTSLTVTKTSSAGTACMSQLSGNAMYSQDFSGAQFSVRIYDSSTKAWGSASTYSTDANGKFTISGLYIGDKAEITEKKAPKGYLLPSAKTSTVQLKSGSNSVSFADEPAFDRGTLKFKKAAFSNGRILTDEVVEGAVYRMDYFDNETRSGSPRRSWYFRTDSDGVILYSNAYLAPGYSNPALYVDRSGSPGLPLGSVSLTEVYAPPGYLRYYGSLDGVIAMSSDSAKFSWITGKSAALLLEGEASVTLGEEELVIAVSKIDGGNGRPLAGAGMQLIENGNVLLEWESDGAEKRIKNLLTAGKTYTIHESYAPEGYDLSEDITFSVAEDGMISVITEGRSTFTTEDNIFGICMEDTKKLVLPETGAAGTLPSVFAGSLLILAGLGLFPSCGKKH